MNLENNLYNIFFLLKNYIFRLEMWDTSKKLYILTRNVGHSIDILEKKFCFFCFCFSLCFVLLKRHKAMLSMQKSQHLGPPQLFWPLVSLCFVLLITQLCCLAKKSALGSISINHSFKPCALWQ